MPKRFRNPIINHLITNIYTCAAAIDGAFFCYIQLISVREEQPYQRTAWTTGKLTAPEPQDRLEGWPEVCGHLRRRCRPDSQLVLQAESLHRDILMFSGETFWITVSITRATRPRRTRTLMLLFAMFEMLLFNSLRFVGLWGCGVFFHY